MLHDSHLTHWLRTQAVRVAPWPDRTLPENRSCSTPAPTMTSFRQAQANRRNAAKSTGPKSEAGKRRSRRNAIRHGLSAETVIEVLEDPEDYRAFEAAVTADYDARTTVERELALRLASLLWRLRRATAIETGLLAIQGEMLRDAKRKRVRRAALQATFGLHAMMIGGEVCHPPPYRNAGSIMPDQEGDTGLHDAQPAQAITVAMARCFLRLANVDNGSFERLSRYETALGRRVGQIISTLNLMRRQDLDSYKRTRDASTRLWAAGRPIENT
jgi:hypothetical protein